MKDLQRLVVSTRCQKIVIKSNCGDLDNQDEFSLNKIVVTKSSHFHSKEFSNYIELTVCKFRLGVAQFVKRMYFVLLHQSSWRAKLKINLNKGIVIFLSSLQFELIVLTRDVIEQWLGYQNSALRGVGTIPGRGFKNIVKFSDSISSLN